MKRARTSRFAWVLALLLGLALSPLRLAAQGQGETVLYQENFDDRAQGWQLDPGWKVVQDGDNWVLAGEGHQWARPGVSYPSDFRLQFRLNLLKGRIHLVYRLAEAARYFIGFHEGGSDLNKQYFPDTFQNGLIGSATPHALGTWHQVEIVGQGPLLRFLVDGQVEWEYSDPDPLLAGSFAFETMDETVAYVDDILVYGPAPAQPPASPPTPAPTSPPTQAPAPSPAAGVSLGWVRTGGPLGGLGYDVRMRSDNPDAMYVTDAWAGVHLSSDGGQTWSPANEGITVRTGDSGDAIPVFCLTIDPHDPDVIWAGTQFQRGIFKTTDAGRTWTRMDNGIVEREGVTFRGFTVDPRSSSVVYAAAEISSWIWNGQPRNGREFDMTQGVVYRTTDGGENWEAIWRGDNLARYVWIDPRDSNVIYVSTGIFDREAANSDPAARVPGGVGIVKSTDGGQTWGGANGGLENLYIGSLFMHPGNPDILLAGTGNIQYSAGGGVYLSTDGGASWQQTLDGEIIESVEFSLADPDIAYAGGANAIYRSEDGGHRWRQVCGGENGWGPPGVRAGFPIDFQVDPRDANRVFANEYGGGNFLSVDGGRTWTVASTGYTGAQVRDVAVDPATDGRVLAAARSGIFVSADGGVEWAGLSYPPAASLEWYAVAIDPADPQHVLAATNWDGLLLQSRDGGRNWSVVSRVPGPQMGWRAIAFAPSEPETVYAGTAGFVSAGTFDGRVPAGGIYVSSDGGTTWAPAHTALSQDAHVTSLAVDPHDRQRVYAATANHGLLASRDGGQSWTALQQGLPGSAAALAVAVSPGDASAVYAGFWRGGLYRSTDGGASWELSAAGLNPEASISDIVLDPTHPQAMYAADLHSGVYRSEDGGTTWMAVNEGLRMRAVNALAISADGLHLYAGTEGEGDFRLDLNGRPPLPAPVVSPTEVVGTPAPGWRSPVPGGSTPLPGGPGPSAPSPLPRLALRWLIYASAAILVVVLVLLAIVLGRRRRKR